MDEMNLEAAEVLGELQAMGHGGLVQHALDRCVNRRLTARIAELEERLADGKAES